MTKQHENGPGATIADIREVAAICLLSSRWAEKGKMTQAEAYSILWKGMLKIEKAVKELAEKFNL